MELSNISYSPISSQRKSILMFNLLMLISLRPWFVYFYVDQHVLIALDIVLSTLSYAFSPRSFCFKARDFGIFLVLMVAAMLGTVGNFNAFLTTFICCVPFFVFMCASQELRIATLASFNKMFYWILGISLLFWYLHLAGMPLPHVHLDAPGETTYEFDNYFVFIRNTHITASLVPRFCSIFLEPGYIACLCVIMLFLYRFNLRKFHNKIYLVSLFASFSLAGWLFFFIALIPYMAQKGRGKWYYLLLVVSFVGLFLYLNTESDNVVNTMIGSRLSIEDGRLSGYNRANDELRKVWSTDFWNSDNVLFGYREDFISRFDFGASVDSRAYIMRYGLLAFIAYVWFLVRGLKIKYSYLGLWLFIIVALFVYRGYSVMFLHALLFLYISSLEFLKRESSFSKTSTLSNNGWKSS